MFQGVKPRIILLFWAAFFAFIFFSSVGTIQGQDNPIGNITGFIYAQNGTTPLEGAVVKFKNVSTGKLYESRKSDSKGFFGVQGIERGVYVYGVLTPKGAYNSEGLVGLRLKENETAKMSIALKPYKKEAASSMEEFYEDLEINGESYVGKIVEFDATKRIAQVRIERGFIQVKDKIRTKGRQTDFKQGVDYLESEGAKVKRVYAGQTASLKMKQKADVDDMVFIVKKKRFLPFIFSPLGAAAVIAASGAVGYGMSILLKEECEPCSPERNKRK